MSERIIYMCVPHSVLSKMQKKEDVYDFQGNIHP
jgi:hypothetical protein